MEKNRIMAMVAGLFSLLAVTCDSALNVTRPDLDERLAANGQGRFTLCLAPQTMTRTILPDTPPLSAFDYFRLVFTPTGGDALDFAAANPGHAAFTPDPFPYGADIQVVLIAGTYTIRVYAYRGAVVSGGHGAFAENTGVTVNLGLNTAITMTLALVPGVGEGTFAWTSAGTMTASDVTSALMDITGITGTTADITGINILTESAGNRTLSPGIYQVRFTLERTAVTGTDPVSGDITELQLLIWYELLHIYSTLISGFALPFGNGHFFNTHFNVTFVMNPAGHGHIFGGAAPVGTQSIEHNGLVTLEPAAGGYTFNGWYRTFTPGTPPVFANPWNLAADRVFSHMTLYARWTPNEVGVEILPPDEPPLVLNIVGVTLPINLAQGGSSVTIAAADITSPLGTITGLTWRFATEPLTASRTFPIVIDPAYPLINFIGRSTVVMDFYIGTRRHLYHLPFNIAAQADGTSM